MSELPSVLVLGGGPGAEREISLASARAVAAALREAGHEVIENTLGPECPGTPAPALRAGSSIPDSGTECRGTPAPAILAGSSIPDSGTECRGTQDVVFPALHGSFGEGGALQDLLERAGKKFVGSRAGPARLAMDKLATKLEGALAGVATPGCAVLNPDDAACPIPLPVVVKPVHEGSSVGLMMCRGQHDWARAHERVRSGEFGGRVFMVEALIPGRELTVGLLAGENGELEALPIVEIVPAEGVYDYEAKYTRGDTAYVVEPTLPGDVGALMRDNALRLAGRLGVRHLCRVDFMLDEAGAAWLLEVNTMPGFTATSLLPKAAGRVGVELPALVSRLVRLAKDETEA